MTLEDAIYEKLMKTPDVVARVGHRVHRGWRPAKETLPCVTLVRITTNPLNSAGGVEPTRQATVQIDIWAKDQPTARTIADAITAALGTWTHASSPATSPPNLLTEADIIEQGAPGTQAREHRISQDWSFWHVL